VHQALTGQIAGSIILANQLGLGLEASSSLMQSGAITRNVNNISTFALTLGGNTIVSADNGNGGTDTYTDMTIQPDRSLIFKDAAGDKFGYLGPYPMGSLYNWLPPFRLSRGDGATIGPWLWSPNSSTVCLGLNAPGDTCTVDTSITLWLGYLYAAGAHASPYTATLYIGGGPFDGTTTGHFAGSASGTAIGVNEVNGYAGNLFDVQVAGVSQAKISAAGILTLAGSTFVLGGHTCSIVATVLTCP